MINHWLRPVNLKEVQFDQLNRWQLGKRIFIPQDEFPDLSGYHIAIVGISAKDSLPIRTALYQMSYSFPKLRIVDLGNARNEDPSFVIQILNELLISGICPVLLAPSTQYTVAQYQAYHTRQELASLLVVDEKIALETDGRKKEKGYLNKIFESKKPKLFNLGILGYQSYYTANSIIETLENNFFEHLRLGKLRPDISEAEPIIRNADLLSFNLSAVRHADAPGQEYPTPGGLSLEEACMISRYAGMSDKLSAAGFFGYKSDFDPLQLGAQLMAQLLWYFMEGFYHRKNDFPISNEGLIEYIVNFKKLNYDLTFWKSARSGRWWMQVPVKTNKRQQRHKLVPCSYKDYLLACNDDLPDRLLNAYKRFEIK